MPPRLIFVPPLGSTTKVPLSHACSDSITFKIYCTLTSDWFTKLRNEGKSIEVWSDLPGAGRSRGQWGEMPFLEQTKTARSSQSSSNSSIAGSDGLVVSLLSPEEEVTSRDDVVPTSRKDGRVTLVATYTVPQIYSHYSYTFRIAGLNGRVEWLGTMGTNGVVIVGEPGHRSGFDEHTAAVGQWSSPGRKWERATDTETIVEIGRFKNVEMVGWAFARGGFSEKVTSLNTTGPANLFLLHPRHDAVLASRPFTDPPSSLVIYSPGNSTVLCNDGTLMTHAREVFIKEFDPNTFHADLQTATAQDWEVLDVPDARATNFLVLKATAGLPNAGGLLPSSTPVDVTIVPSVAADTLPAVATVSFPLSQLCQLQPNSPSSMIYTVANDCVSVIDLTAPESQDAENLSVVVGRDGGQMLIVPGYQIGSKDGVVDNSAEEVESSPNDIWEVGVLDPAIAAMTIAPDVPPPPPSLAPIHPHVPSHVEEDGVNLATPNAEDAAFVPPPPEPLSVATATSEEPADDKEPSPTSTIVEPVEQPVAPAETAVVKTPKPLATLETAGLGMILFEALLASIQLALSLWLAFLASFAKREKPKPAAATLVKIAEAAAAVGKPAVAEKVTGHEETLTTDQPAVSESVSEPAKVEQSETPGEKDVAAASSGEVHPQRPKLTASKSILTPPITPPLSPLVMLANRLAAGGDATAPPSEEHQRYSMKTKLAFSLPSNANKFSFALYHRVTALAGGASRDEGRIANREALRNLKIHLDGKELSLFANEEDDDVFAPDVRSTGWGAGRWIVEVDAREKREGTVEVAVF